MNRDIEVVIPLTRYNECKDLVGLLEWLVIEYIQAGLHTTKFNEFSDMDVFHFHLYTYDEIHDLIIQFREEDTADEVLADAAQVSEAMEVLMLIVGDLDSFLSTKVASTLAERVQHGMITLSSVSSVYNNSVVLHFESLV
jgi:hypothetical protein